MSRVIWFLLSIPVLLVVLILLLPVLMDPSYGFRHRSARYHADFARACDALIAQHPAGTNQFIELAINDPSLPKIIRDLPPFRVQVGNQRVWVLAGGTGHATGFGITWAPKDEAHTNLWVLTSTMESFERLVYTERR